MRITKIIITSFACTISIAASAQVDLATYGVQLNCTDIKKAAEFYHDILGFHINITDSATILLKPRTGDETIMIRKVNYLLAQQPNEARATLTLQVNKLDSTIARLKRKGVNLGNYQKRKEGVGYAMHIDDPFGTRLSLMHETVVANPTFDEPKIYNYGFYIPDMPGAIDFYSRILGFPIRSNKYLPLDMPLNNTDGTFGFMLHTRDGVEPIHFNSPDNEHVVIVFKTKDLDVLIANLGKAGVTVQKKIELFPNGRTISFYDPFGYISRAIEIPIVRKVEK